MTDRGQDPLLTLAKGYAALCAFLIALLLPLLWRHAVNSAELELSRVQQVMDRGQTSFARELGTYAADLDLLHLGQHVRSDAEEDALDRVLARDLAVTASGDSWCVSVDAHVRYVTNPRYERHLVPGARWPRDGSCPGPEDQ